MDCWVSSGLNLVNFTMCISLFGSFSTAPRLSVGSQLSTFFDYSYAGSTFSSSFSDLDSVKPITSPMKANFQMQNVLHLKSLASPSWHLDIHCRSTCALHRCVARCEFVSTCLVGFADCRTRRRTRRSSSQGGLARVPPFWHLAFYLPPLGILFISPSFMAWRFHY